MCELLRRSLAVGATAARIYRRLLPWHLVTSWRLTDMDAFMRIYPNPTSSSYSLQLSKDEQGAACGFNS